MQNSPDTWRIIYKHGQPFYKKGSEELPVLMYNSGRISSDTPEGQARLKRYRGAGFRFYVLAALLDEEFIWQPDGTSHLEIFQRRIDGFFKTLPDCHLLIFIDLRPPKWWLDAHQEEIIQYASGAQPDIKADDLFNIMMPSYASLLFQKECGEQIRHVVRYLEDSPYANSILAYHCNWGVYSEWHGFGMMREMPDVGPAMTRAFHEFLLKKYESDEALQKAWGRSDAHRDSAPVPGKELRTKRTFGTLRNPKMEQEVVDGMLCYQQELRKCQENFNILIKKECENRRLVGNYSGYFFGAGYPMEGLHYYTPAMLAGDVIDYQVSPYCYMHRAVGQNGFSRSVLESYTQNDKLLIFESDTRTHKSAPAARFSTSAEDDIALLTRDFAQSLLRGGGLWFYDFLHGWYDQPYILELFRKMHKIANGSYDMRRPSQVAYVADFTSFLVTAPADGPSDIPGYLSNCMAEELTHCGISFDTILVEDILSGKAREYQTYIFGNLFRNDEQITAMVSALRKAGKGIIWMYASGAFKNNESTTENIEDLTGFHLTRHTHSENDTEPILCAEENLPDYFKGLPPQQFGGWKLNNFQLLPAPGQVPVVQCKPGNGSAVAIRQDGESMEMFSVLPMLPRDILIRFFRQQGIHQYLPTGSNVLYASRQLLAIHSPEGGLNTISLPEKVKGIRQLLPDEKDIPLLSDRQFQITLQPRSTVLFALQFQ